MVAGQSAGRVMSFRSREAAVLGLFWLRAVLRPPHVRVGSEDSQRVLA